jgi:uncharacterized protein (DUF2147 family)
MERQIKFLLSLLSILISFFFSLNSLAAENSPVGYWKIVDGTTGKTKNIVQIWQMPGQLLVGKIVRAFPVKASHPLLCTTCRGQQYNQPLVGMTILSGLKSRPHQWSSGKILNLENGKTYSCAVRTLENGKKLNVKIHYLGLPFLAKSETWERIDLMSG